MPDLLNYTATRLSAANVNVPRWQLSGRLVDSTNQATVLADFTGANTVNFPAVLSTLTAPQQDELIVLIVMWLLQKKFPQFF